MKRDTHFVAFTISINTQQPTSGASCIYKCNMIKFYRQIALNDRMKRTPRRQYELS